MGSAGKSNLMGSQSPPLTLWFLCCFGLLRYGTDFISTVRYVNWFVKFPVAVRFHQWWILQHSVIQNCNFGVLFSRIHLPSTGLSSSVLQFEMKSLYCQPQSVLQAFCQSLPTACTSVVCVGPGLSSLLNFVSAALLPPLWCSVWFFSSWLLFSLFLPWKFMSDSFLYWFSSQCLQVYSSIQSSVQVYSSAAWPPVKLAIRLQNYPLF